MSDRNDHMDEILRGKLKYYASETPEHLWEKIDAARTPQQDTDKVGFGWWRGLSVGLLLFIMLGGLTFITTTTNPDKEKALITKTSIEPTIQTTTTTNENSTIAIEIPDQSQKNITSVSTAVKEKTITNRSSKTKNTATAQREKNNSADASKEGFTTSNQPLKTSTTTQLVNAVGITDVGSLYNNKLITSLNNNVSTISDKPSSEVNSLTKTTYADSDMAMLALTSQVLEAPEMEISESMSKFKPNCYNFRRAMGYGYYVDVFFSPEIAIRTLEAKNSDFTDYVNARETTESFRYAFSTGVRFSMVNQQGFTYRTGIVYSNITERFDFETTELKDSVFVLVDTSANNSGGTNEFWQLVNDHPVTTTYKIYNHFKMIDIPIILGYEFENEKYVVSINGGAYFNILFKPKGQFLSPTLEPVEFSVNSRNRYAAFTERVGISAFGSIGLGYKLKHNLQLLLEPNFRYQFKPVTIDGYPLQQKYLNVGIMLGVRHKF